MRILILMNAFEVEHRNGEGSIPGGGNSPSEGGWIVATYNKAQRNEPD